MRERGESRPGRLWILLFAALVVALATTVAACGGGEEESATQTGEPTTGGAATGEAIKIGIFANNEGPFAPFEGQTWGGAMLPLINRGATPVSGDPTEGVDNAVIAGHPIELVYGGSDATPDKAVEEARRLRRAGEGRHPHRPALRERGHRGCQLLKERLSHLRQRISGAQDTTLKVARRTSSASTTTARSGRRGWATTPTTPSVGETSSRSATTTTSRIRRSRAS